MCLYIFDRRVTDSRGVSASTLMALLNGGRDKLPKRLLRPGRFRSKPVIIHHQHHVHNIGQTKGTRVMVTPQLMYDPRQAAMASGGLVRRSSPVASPAAVPQVAANDPRDGVLRKTADGRLTVRILSSLWSLIPAQAKLVSNMPLTSPQSLLSTPPLSRSLTLVILRSVWSPSPPPPPPSNPPTPATGALLQAAVVPPIQPLVTINADHSIPCTDRDISHCPCVSAGPDSAVWKGAPCLSTAHLGEVS